MHRLNPSVASLLNTVARDIVMPRFRNLAEHEVSEKSRGEVVTIADNEAEVALHEGLLAIDASARVVGEEACSRTPELLDDLASGRVWVVDPIDGTSNFASGTLPFGMMIALVEDGETQAAWLYDPVKARHCHAVSGAGAFIDGERIWSRPSGKPRPIAALATQFMPVSVAERVRSRAAETYDVVPIPRCAADHYPRLVLGENDVALFQRTLPWDHLAGTLFLTEAGGRITRWDGSRYHLGDAGTGILAASTEALWAQAMAALGTAEIDVTSA